MGLNLIVEEQNMAATLRKISLWATAVSLGCGGGGESTDAPKATPTVTIPLGAVLDRSGVYGGGSWDDAADLAVEHMNAALVQTNHPVRFALTHSDSTGVPAVAAARATELVAAGAKALVIDVSPNDLEILARQYGTDELAKLNVPLVGIAVTSPLANNPNACKTGTKPDCTTGLDENGDNAYTRALRDAEHWNYRTNANTTQQANVIAKVAQTKGMVTKKATVLYSNDGYGTGAQPGTVAALKAVGYTVVESVKICAVVDTTCTEAVGPNEMAKYNAWVAQALDNMTGTTADAVPDVIVVQATPTYMVGVIRAYKQVIPAPTVPLIHCAALRTMRVLSGLGSDADGSEGVGPVAADGIPGQTFQAAYQAKYGIQLNNYDNNNYDAATLTMLASLIAAQGFPDPSTITGADVRTALATLSTPGGLVVGTGTAEFVKAINAIALASPINYEGASGPLDFDANNQVVNRVVHFKIIGTTFTDLSVYDCVADPSCPLAP
jgi:ABC-type branched-subunit amino acid transport system substrate-binding protein